MPSISDISVENIEDVTAVLAWNVSGIGEDFQEIQHFTVMRWKLGDERSLFIFTESKFKLISSINNIRRGVIK